MQIKMFRKEIADMLRAKKIENARIRVEAVIRENLLLQAFEILELYLELVSVRSQLIGKTKEVPRDCIEAISSVVYAAQRLGDLQELMQLRAMFAAKYGNAYVNEAASDITCVKWQVNENLRRCLQVEPPPPEEKLQELFSIVKEHQVDLDLDSLACSILPYPLRGAVKGEITVGLGATSGTSHSLVSEVDAEACGVMGAGQQVCSPGYVEPGMYQTAQQAAYAAQHAAALAQAAAQYAVHFAQHPASQMHPPPYPMACIPPFPLPPMDTTQGAPDALPHYQSTPQADTYSPNPTNMPPMQGREQHVSVNFVIKSDEEIQKAYDTATGPPVKASAPPPPVNSLDAPQPGNPSLPSAPLAFDAPIVAHPATPPLPIAPLDEYELLTQRLEALKRS